MTFVPIQFALLPNMLKFLYSLLILKKEDMLFIEAFSLIHVITMVEFTMNPDLQNKF